MEKVCAIKTGMGLKHRAVEQNDRFGGGVWSVAEADAVAVEGVAELG